MNITIYEWLILCGTPAIVVSIVNGIFRLLVNKHNAKKQNNKDEWDENRAIREGLQALLMNSLQKDYRYYTEKGYCSLDDKAKYQKMYDCYHEKLHLPNGIMEECYLDVMKLPIKKIGE